jgi:hypothetical protein
MNLRELHFYCKIVDKEGLSNVTKRHWSEGWWGQTTTFELRFNCVFYFKDPINLLTINQKGTDNE